MEKSGVPPMPNQSVNAVISVIIGKQTPTPVRARPFDPGRCPMYTIDYVVKELYDLSHQKRDGLSHDGFYDRPL